MMHHERMTFFSDYLHAFTGSESKRATAKRVDMDPLTLTRQLDGRSRLTMETVMALHRAYDFPLGDALLATGWLTPEELDSLKTEQSAAPTTYSDTQLLRLLLTRAEQREQASNDTLDDPLADLPADANEWTAEQVTAFMSSKQSDYDFVAMDDTLDPKLDPDEL